MHKKSNIIIINPDQWRGDSLGHLGHPAAITPNLNKVVREDAISFSNAFCQAQVLLVLLSGCFLSFFITKYNAL